MKKLILFFLFSFTLIYFSNGQVLCVQSFQQNDSVYAGTTNLILNGGFENTDCSFSGMAVTLTQSFCPNSAYYHCNIDNWTCTGGGIHTYCCFRDSTYFVEEGTHSAYFGNGYCKVCSATIGDTSCFIYNGCVVTGIPSGYPNTLTTGFGDTAGISLSQNVSGLIVGHTYLLEFWAGGEYDNIFTLPGLFAINIGFGRTFLREKSTPAVTGIGTRFLITFKAISTSHTIKFTNWGHMAYGSGCTELVIDNVKLYALPLSVIPCTIGIEEFEENIITVLPNPITSELIINPGNNQPTEIILYDLSSRKLLQQTFTNTTKINTEQLAKGMYLYEIRNRNGIIKNGKVIKQ